jgi:hypothetical protein
LSDGTYRGRWQDEVLGTPHCSAEVKVLLLAMSLQMDDAGCAAIPRDDLAVLLRCHPRKVTEKIKTAIDAGLLRRTARGNNGRTAQFQGVIPRELSRVPPPSTLQRMKGADSQHPTDLMKGADSQHPSNGKGAESRHPTDAEGCRQSASPYKRPAEVGDNETEGVVISLFDEKDQIPPPAGATAPADEEPKPITAQDVVAAWIDGVRDATGERPPKALLGQVARQAKELVSEDRNPERLVAAARSLGQKVGKGYADLGREYLMASASSPARAASGSDVPPRDAYIAEDFI